MSALPASAAVLLGLAACASAAAVPAPPDRAGVRIERHLTAMGTGLTVEVRAADRPRALAASEAAVRAIEAVEGRLSTWREDTELAALNRSSLGEPVPLSPKLRDDLYRAWELSRATGGAFDPGVGALVAAWGLRTGGRVPSREELAAALAATGIARFDLRGNTLTRLCTGARIEEGGFGKGVGLDAAREALEEADVLGATVDLGGQVLHVARAGSAEPLRYAIADPRERERPVVELAFASGSLATSGNSERAVVVGAERIGHLLDPRTGRPARDFGSVTVLAQDATTADALSTGLFVLGPSAALDWARREPSIDVLVLEVVRTESGEERLVATGTPGLRGRLRTLDPTVELRVLNREPKPR